MVRMLTCDSSAEARLRLRGLLAPRRKVKLIEAADAAEPLAQAVARELADLPGAVCTGMYLAAPDLGLSAAAIAGPGALPSLQTAPAVVFRAFLGREPARADAGELAELFRLGIACGEALAVPLLED